MDEEGGRGRGGRERFGGGERESWGRGRERVGGGEEEEVEERRGGGGGGEEGRRRRRGGGRGDGLNGRAWCFLVECEGRNVIEA